MRKEGGITLKCKKREKRMKEKKKEWHHVMEIFSLQSILKDQRRHCLFVFLNIFFLSLVTGMITNTLETYLTDNTQDCHEVLHF